MVGFKAAADELSRAGCQTIYLDGSFVSDKKDPRDFDACWELVGVDPQSLDPVLLDFSNGRAAQKAKYLGELFPASFAAERQGITFLEFFQTDKATGNQKGIIGLDLGGL